MFENLNDRLSSALKLLKGKGQITDVNVATTVKEIRRALLDADVSFEVAKSVTDQIKEEAIGKKVLIAVDPGQLFTKIVFDKLVEMMGKEAAAVHLSGSPAVVLVAGLQGSGKTTFCSKLANRYKREGRQVLLAACDVYRPAAINQLITLGQQIGVEVYAEPENKNAVQIAQNAVSYAKKNGKNILIVDTAGRLAIDQAMMEEISKVKNAISPSETLFVVDSMTGQDAVNTAKAFHDKLNYDGIVLTKLDGDTRGGAALTIRMVVQKPIKFMSMGEKPDTLDVFHPDRMARRILGMGDVLTLVEKAQQNFDQQEMDKLAKKMRKNKFDLDDLLSQMRQVKKMGSLKDLASMIPGMGKISDQDVDESVMVRMEAIICSMTPKERSEPEILNMSRKQRIAKGSGTTLQDINTLLKQFEQMKAMIKQMNQMQTKGLFGKKKR
jgi:signal recognition particle subunit SRP54